MDFSHYSILIKPSLIGQRNKIAHRKHWGRHCPLLTSQRNHSYCLFCIYLSHSVSLISVNLFSENNQPTHLTADLIDYNMPLTTTYLKQKKLQCMNSNEQVHHNSPLIRHLSYSTFIPHTLNLQKAVSHFIPSRWLRNRCGRCALLPGGAVLGFACEKTFLVS